MMRRSVFIDGHRIDCVSEGEAVQLILNAVHAGRGGWVWTPNVDMLRQCRESKSLEELMREPDIVIADGMPLVWASRLMGTPLPERVAGSQVIWRLCEAAAQKDIRVFLLGGGKPDIADRAAQRLQQAFPGLRVVGTYYPPFGFDHDAQEHSAIVEALTHANPQIIFFALSYPKGEFLVKRIRGCCPTAVWMGVGISFSYITLDVKPPPAWMRQSGFEWLHRMLQEPGRLHKRYLGHDLPYALSLLARSVRARLASLHNRTFT